MMSEAEFSHILGELSGVTEYVYYHLMGEPLTHPQLPDFIRMSSDRGFKSVLTTNGTLLKRRGDEILSAGLHKVSISVHSFEEGSEEDFEKLCLFVKEARFERFGAFTYSPEEGTPAADFDGEIDEQTKQDRYDILMQTQLTVTEELSAGHVGKTLEVICEGFDTVAEVYYGRSYMDAPDVDGRVYFTSKRKLLRGDFVKVKINEALDYDLVGEERT